MTHLGLRARASAVFAAGAFVVSASLAAGTYQLTRQSLVTERERTATRAAYFDAAVVRQGLATEGAAVVDVLRTLDTGQGRRPLVLRGGQWFARTADTGFTAAVPESLRAVVRDGSPGVQRVSLNGVPTLVVGVPLRDVDANYYELTAQTELQRTLRQLGITLAVGALATTLAGAALGLWASRRILHPLASVARAARTIAAGDLTTRLDPARDADLAPLTDAFNEMVDELEVRVEADRRFAADVSHELRSPLQTLTAATGVLANRRDSFDARTGLATDLVVSEVDRFSALVEDLLELARGDRPVERREVPVAAALRSVCDAHGVEPRFVRVDARLTWPLDARRFERAAANLVDNAKRHAGGVTSLVCDADDDVLRLVVQDAGPGVPPDERRMIFDRFGRGRRASARGGTGASDGTGLGLALVAQHVAAHGGTVEVADADGGGACFIASFPRGRP